MIALNKELEGYIFMLKNTQNNLARLKGTDAQSGWNEWAKGKVMQWTGNKLIKNQQVILGEANKNLTLTADWIKELDVMAASPQATPQPVVMVPAPEAQVLDKGMLEQLRELVKLGQAQLKKPDVNITVVPAGL